MQRAARAVAAALLFIASPLALAAGGAFAGGYQMGTVVWKVKAGVSTDSVDILSGVLNQALDAFGDSAFNDISNLVLGNPASVNVAAPEPGTAALLGLGLLGLGLASRRRPA